MITADNILHELEAFDKASTDNYSLYHGKTGLSIAYFILSKMLNSNDCKQKGQKLINEVAENIADVNDLTFKNGLSGIGWAIEWIVQQKFISANTDDILEELDDQLYKNVVYTRAPDLSIENGVVGRAMYFYRRLMARNPGTSRYRNLVNQECLVLLTDELYDRIDNNVSTVLCDNKVYPNVCTMEMAQILLFSASAKHLKINEDKTKKIICRSLGAISEYIFSEGCFETRGRIDDDLYLMNAFLNAAIHLKDPHLTRQAKGLCYKRLSGRVENLVFSDRSWYIITLLAKSLRIPVKPPIPHVIQTKRGVFDLLKSISLMSASVTDTWHEAWAI